MENSEANEGVDMECTRTSTWHLHEDRVSVQVLQEADTKAGLDVQEFYKERQLWGEMGSPENCLMGDRSEQVKQRCKEQSLDGSSSGCCAVQV